MMRVRKADKGEKGCFLILSRFQIGNRAVADIGRWVQFLWNWGAIGLWTGIVVRQLVFGVMQRLPIRGVFTKPLAIMPPASVPV